MYLFKLALRVLYIIKIKAKAIIKILGFFLKKKQIKIYYIYITYYNIFSIFNKIFIEIKSVIFIKLNYNIINKVNINLWLKQILTKITTFKSKLK